MIIGIDPGPDVHGMVAIKGGPAPMLLSRPEVDATIDDIAKAIVHYQPEAVVCEWITSMGMAVGASVFDTCRQVGRIEERCSIIGAPFELLPRMKVKHLICGSTRAKDSNIRQALIDLYPRDCGGGGKTPQIGTKKAPGPLYGMKSHAWPALAVAVAWLRSEKRGA